MRRWINDVVELQREYEELKGLPYWTLMLILDLNNEACGTQASDREEELEEQVSDLESEIRSLESTNADLEYDYDNLKEKHEKLLKELEDLKEKYNDK